MVPKAHESKNVQEVFIMARANTPPAYKCGSCNEFGHNKRTCPALGLAPKVKPVKKPRAKKVIEETVTAPSFPLATAEEIEALHATVEALIAADAEENEVSEVEPTDDQLAEIEAGDVDAAFEAEEEVFSASDVTDEEAAAFLDEYAALFA
jgi:hypothetical protein